MPTLTDEQLAALGLAMPPPDVSMAPASPPAAILPASAPPSFPKSILGDQVAPGQRITHADLLSLPHEVGKQLYQDEKPDVTAPAGTIQWNQQRQQELAYNKAHPWGAPISAHPGVLGSILHGLSVAGNIAGDVVAPRVMANIPGTQLHNDIVSANLGRTVERQQGEESEQALRGAQTEKTEADTDALENPQAKQGLTPEETTIHDLMAGDNGTPRVNPATKKPYSYLEAYMAVQQAKQSGKSPKPERPDTPEQQFIDDFQKRNPDKTVADAVAAYASASQRPEKAGAGEGRSDKSYQFNAGRIDKLAAPIEQRAERIARLEDTLNQNNPQADALVAPELLTVMAGGQGSGLRMNEAEIARIIGGRDKWETIKSKLAEWQMDPSKPFAFQPEQRQEIRNLFATIRQRVSQKSQILDEGRAALIETDDPKQHRQIVQQVQQKLNAVDSGMAVGTGKAPQIGAMENGYRFKGGDPSKKESWEKQ